MRTARGRSFALPTFSAAIILAGTFIGSIATASAAVPNEVADAASAQKLAKQGGKPIVIGSEMTETSEVKANPDGTRTLTEYTHPVRVKQNNAWTAVDLTLVKRADGTVAPKAASVTMSFSAGGPGSARGPIAKLVKGDAEIGFGWDTDLPPAQIDGQTVIYPEVLPGVDLELKSALTGFAQNLVVKTAEAAKNPALKKITFKSHTKNTKVAKGSTGPAAKSATSDGLVVTGPDGKEVFSGDASRMWDSSNSARGSVMGVEVGANTISITPDQAFLADPQTVYPVRLDPDFYCTTCSKAHHAVVQSVPAWRDARNYDRTDGKLGDLKAGYVNAVELQAPVAGVSRTYFQMWTHGIVGKRIYEATVRAHVIKSYSCSPSPTQLVLTNGFGPDITWNNQPGWGETLSENNKRNNPDASCQTDRVAEFDATAAAVKASEQRWDMTSFMFKAKNEEDLDKSWRRFELNPYLQVRFNSKPEAPFDWGLQGWGPDWDDALPCVRHTDARPAVATRTPRLRARLWDHDDEPMRADFVVYKGPVGDGVKVASPSVTMVPSWDFAEVTVPKDAIADDGLYHFDVGATDDKDFSPWSGDCEFWVDTIDPRMPAVTSSDYPETGQRGSPGRTGIFRFSPNGNTGPNGSMDVVQYGWSLNVETFDNRVDVTAADGVMEVPITPREGGTNSLFVTAFDRAGNAGEPREYVFNVADPSNPIAAWNFDETGGDTAADITGKGHPLTLNGAAFGSAYANNGQVNNTSSFSSTSTPLLNTEHAFSVSAWAKLDKADSFYTVASQDGGSVSGFYLQYSDAEDRWSFSAATEEGSNPSTVRAVSSAPPELGVWTHLLGTYEPNSREMKIYVNGKLEGTANAKLFGTTGLFVVGAAKWNGGRVDRFPGVIDHVKVWDRALNDAEAANQSNFAVLRAHYNLDERVGTATRDEVTGQNGTLSGGVRWAGTPADPDDPDQLLISKDKWLKFDESGTGEVAGARPANLRTNRSYTVTAWIRNTATESHARAAIGLAGATHSPFLLGYRPETGRWGFTVAATESGGGEYALSNTVAEANKWVHLAATYDFTTSTITLYVNGTKQNTARTGVQTFNSSGGLWLGRGIWDGHRSDPWQGDVDDARVYTGVLSDDAITVLFSATMHR